VSVRVMTQVWALDLPDSEKIVLLALADCANDEGHCWPGMKSLVKKCSKTDRTVQAAIKALCDAGHLTRREVLGKGCNYTVHPRSDFTPEQASPPKATTQTPEAVSGKPSRTVSSEDKSSGASADPVKDLIDMGVALLTETGLTERNARSLIGKWRKGRDVSEIALAFADCRTKAIANPVEWLERRLKSARFVSKSGYEYRGNLDAIIREAEKRADWDTFWGAKMARDEEAGARPKASRVNPPPQILSMARSIGRAA
jgi:hypothetical protein